MTEPNRPRYSNDERLSEAQREQYDAAADELQRRGQGTGSDGGAGAAGAIAAPVIILGSILVFMLYACIYPVGALVAIVTGFVVSSVFGALVPGVGWMGHFLVLLPLAWGALMIFQQRVEWRLEQRRSYLLARHILRLCFTFVIVGLSLTFFAHTEELRARQPFEESYSWTHLVIVVAAIAIVHFVGTWHDRRLVQVVPTEGPKGWRPVANGVSRKQFRMPGLQSLPGPLGHGLPLMSLAGGLMGAFLGYAGFETLTSTLVGLFAGCIGGALLMSACWLATRPIGGLFDRAPVLWPLLMGAIVGLVVAWRLALADHKALAAYTFPGVVGGALVLAVPYVIFGLVRRLFVGQSRGETP